jgi:1,4-dihydroxy-2-naphthoate polyprenyltransferase
MDNPLKIWFLAIRPKTLAAAIAPVMLGTGLAGGDGVFHIPSAALCLAAALLIQIGTNLANDYFDYKKGADTSERVGPTRVTQAGLVSPNAVLTAAGITFILAALIAVQLFLRGGWPIAVIAVVSILSGIFYTAGPKPLAYIGLGELFVLIFFGPVAVGGTYYVQSHEINLAVILAGLGPGFLSAAILAVNNLRDIETDRKSGKMTLAARFGAGFAKAEYLILIILAALTPIGIYLTIHDHEETLISIAFLLILAIPIIHTVYTAEGQALNKALGWTGLVLLIYSFAYSIGWII